MRRVARVSQFDGAGRVLTAVEERNAATIWIGTACPVERILQTAA